MDIKIILGFIAAVLAAGSAFVYIRDIFAGNTKPHIYTWLIWTILTAIGFLGQLQGGAGAGAWATGVSLVFCIVTLILAVKYGTKDITNLDRLCLILAIISIIPWVLTQNAVLSVVLATITDVIGFIPTMRKTWNAPKSESVESMYLDALKHIFVIASLQKYSLLTWFLPAGILVAKIAIIAEISYRRSSIKLHKKSHSRAKR